MQKPKRSYEVVAVLKCPESTLHQRVTILLSKNCSTEDLFVGLELSSVVLIYPRSQLLSAQLCVSASIVS